MQNWFRFRQQSLPATLLDQRSISTPPSHIFGAIQQLRQKSIRRGPATSRATFVICFLLLNGLLFVPLSALNWEGMTRSPFAMRNAGDGAALWHQLVVSRETFDPFRLNIELFLLIVLLINIRWLRRAGLRHLFIGLYFFTLCYYIYEAVTLSIYQAEPVFYNHYYMALDGLGYLFAHLNLAGGLYWGALLLLLLGISFIYRLAALLYHSVITTEWRLRTRLVFLGLGALIVAAVLTEQQTLAAPTTILSSLSYKLESNINQSRQLYQEISGFDDAALQRAYDYADVTLSKKPNVFLLFVESYGSVLYKRPDYRIDYALLLKELKRQLDTDGWASTSALSVAPTWGGGSWLSYTSTEFGLRIDNHPYYLTLLNAYQYRRYPHLGNFLHDRGYRTYRLSSLTVDLTQEKWEQYERMYDVDRWFRFEDLDYSGPLYGWGPAAPDQYALHYTQEKILQTAGPEQPFMLFFITQSSHYPYAPLPPLVEDWRTLNEMVDTQAPIDDETREHAVRRQDYFDAIAYDLQMLVQFIVENEDENALFVLIGDHQPPRVSRRDDGFDTPIHIISRDRTLITAFQDHGFTPGLWVNEATPLMKHEGFYSMLVRALASDPQNSIPLPPYFPDGFIQPDVAGAQ